MPNTLAVLSPGLTRPAPVQQAPLPPFDQSDAGGTVHTTPPPELVIPTGPDLMFMRADFNGITLNNARWGFTDETYKSLGIIGANSTPYNMLMTPMLVLYPRNIQDACLTEHAERAYSHFVIAPDGWNLAINGFEATPAAMIAWAQYLKSWSFDVVLWRSEPTPSDPILQAMGDAGCVDWYIAGEEVDRKVSAQQFATVLDTNLAIVDDAIPIGAHTTSNYPEGFPKDTFFDGRSMPGFDFYDGRVHLVWQADQNESAGTQAARCYYARERVNLGLVGGNGRVARNSGVYAFETMATKQFYGQCTEEYGCLRSLELMYATRTDDRVRPMAGYGNGCRLANGDPL